MTSSYFRYFTFLLFFSFLTGCKQSLFEEIKDSKNMVANPRVLKAVCEIEPNDWFCNSMKKTFAEHGNNDTKLIEYQGGKVVHQLLCTWPNCNRFDWVFIDEQSKITIYGGQNDNAFALVYGPDKYPFYAENPMLLRAWGIKSESEIPQWVRDTLEELNRSYVNPEILMEYKGKYGSNKIEMRDGIKFYFDK